MSKGTARKTKICDRMVSIGDYVEVRYAHGTWSKGGVLRGEITEIWGIEEDSHLQARVSGGWCFHDCDEIIEHRPVLDKEGE